MHRFFLPPKAFSSQEVSLNEPGLNHRLRNVLRMQVGDEVIFLDNSGWEFHTVLRQVGVEQIIAEIQYKSLCHSEPRTKVSLYQALIKGDRFEWVLQKGTELGVSAFFPLLCERSIVGDARQISERKLERWRRIIQSAAEQSRRGRLPHLEPLTLFAAACEQVRRSSGLALIPWGKADTPLGEVLQAEQEHRPFNVSILIGPEGGFSPEEIRTAQDYDLIPVSLGPRILRAETAGLVATVLVLYQYGDMAAPPIQE
ncbi:MAG: 16S rRNA (uracil(1498)-N(3))-methyltransferase [Chloroflexia bacterium]|nr:16S rRNA (uracil(1498)-N(3))-methyltransferase [Chloroflexia bacterium]